MTFNTAFIAEPTDADFARAGQILRDGGLVAFPTETVYGLGGNAFDSLAAAKIYAAKGRPSDNPLIVHLATPTDADAVAETTPLFWRLAARFWPGPLTMILPKKPIIPDTVTGGLSTVALRVPSHPMARALIQAAGVPIAAPSANTSGKPSTTTAAHVRADLFGKIEMILDGGACEIGLESTIIKLDGELVTLLRPGGVTYEDLVAVCGAIEIDPAVLAKFDGVPMAPGMKYRHYAPHMPVVLLSGTDEQFFAYLKTRESEQYGVLCYNEDVAKIAPRPYALLGAAGDTAAHARNLFAALRELDGRRDITIVYARLPEKDHIGLALYNRLAKAAGFEMISLH